tara:strand:+ start:1692 stop:1967 length:276 start_codon:yes stop_codon:yes gene_type:complete
MKAPTCKGILLRFLKNRIQSGIYEISSHEFEIDLVKYGQMYWGVKKLPSAYSREWRKLRQLGDYRIIDIERVEEVKTESAESTWKLIPITI